MKSKHSQHPGLAALDALPDLVSGLVAKHMQAKKRKGEEVTEHAGTHPDDAPAEALVHDEGQEAIEDAHHEEPEEMVEEPERKPALIPSERRDKERYSRMVRGPKPGPHHTPPLKPKVLG